MSARLRAVLAALLLMLFAGGAEAHASLLAAEPADGAVLPVSPAQLALQFDEPVEPLQLTLVNAAGQRLVLQAHAEGARLTAELPQPLAKGSYALNYRVVSADSHPVGGSLMFAVGAADAMAPAAAVNAQEAGWPLVLVRGLRDAAVLGVAGLALFMLGVARLPRERAGLAVAATAAIALCVASLVLQGAWLLGQPAAFSLGALNAALHSSFGTSSGVAMLGAACVLLLALAGREAFRPWLLLAGAALCISSFAFTGHAAASPSRVIASAALCVHVLAASFWLGSLIGLSSLLRGDRERASQALGRFSRVAVVMVGVLLAAGIVLVCLQLGSPRELVQSSYGQLIMLKTGLLLLLLALAALNRYVWVPRLQEQGRSVALVHSVRAEIVLMLAVLLATAALVQTSPHASAWQRSLVLNGQRAELTLERDARKDDAVVVQLSTAQGQPLNPAAVELVLTSHRLGIEALHRGMNAAGPGRFVYRGHELLLDGDWQVQVRARIDDFDELRWDFDFRPDQSLP
ncbi:MAG TPA: CopD family protein [Burkholderiaceae bacterium]|jgi:copper transport protein